ncbi:unnamed protein product [Fusarium graminearum]|uniref:Chromosome 1, complete genome n=1 Tax=Gibberella zeae (strain ATCC MYA-4620 / CBS 123657 / FGSC 9075 / NRRL 31084 / PH-1) TaxID=229533 RepID=A0A098D621_GIBZE|nr:unnamed protein product [Fusarium graminearum]CZS76657.1 unnamed protein product [Fusarium graminearum]
MTPISSFNAFNTNPQTWSSASNGHGHDSKNLGSTNSNRSDKQRGVALRLEVAVQVWRRTLTRDFGARFQFGRTIRDLDSTSPHQTTRTHGTVFLLRQFLSSYY